MHKVRYLVLQIAHVVKESPILWMLLLFLFIIGVGLIAFAHGSVGSSSDHLLAEVLRDLGIAFCISVLIAFVIEIGLARSMFANGLDAVMNQTIPPDVWKEIRQHIITQPIVRQKYCLTMNIKPTTEAGELVSETQLTYEIESLKDALSYTWLHELDAHRTPHGTAASRYSRAHVTGGKAERLGDNVTAKLSRDFDHEKDTATVGLAFTEVVKCPDTISWWMRITTRNPEFSFPVLPSDMEVELSPCHPGGQGRLKPVGREVRHWQFDGVMLPGQGVEIRFRKLLGS